MEDVNNKNVSENKNKKYARENIKKLEIVLLFVIVFLLVSLILLKSLHKEYKMYGKEVDYDGYKVDKVENGVIVSTMFQNGNIYQIEDEYVIKDYKIFKTSTKQYYRTVNNAKKEYNKVIDRINENLNSGAKDLPYDVEKEENIVKYNYNNMQASSLTYGFEQEIELSKDTKFDDNDEFKDFVIKNIEESFQNCLKRVD